MFESSLNVAIKKDNIQMVRMLLEGGANPNTTGGVSSWGSSTYEKQAIRCAVRVCCQNMQERNSTTPDTQIIDLLLDSGANPTTALKDSIQANNLIVTKYLLMKKADPNKFLRNLGRSMDVAVQAFGTYFYDFSMMELLLAHGAVIQFSSNLRNSALSLALTKGIELFQFLLQKGGRQALKQKFEGHPPRKMYCPVDNPASDFMIAIGATESCGYLMFECQNNEFSSALSQAFISHIPQDRDLEDYYCYYYYDSYDTTYDADEPVETRCNSSWKTSFRSKIPNFGKARKPNRFDLAADYPLGCGR